VVNVPTGLRLYRQTGFFETGSFIQIQEIPVDIKSPDISVRQAIWDKPEDGQACTNRSMVEIGG